MATNPTKALRDLLLWARKERIVLSSVSMSGITVEIEHDYGLLPPASQAPAPEPKRSIYEQYGGMVLQGVAPVSSEQVNEPTEEDD